MFLFKFRILLLASAMFAMASTSVIANPTDKSLTHHRNGVGVGSAFNSTLLALTASATTEVEIPIGTIRAGDFATSLSSPAAIENAGIGVNLSSTAVVFIARTSDVAEFISATAKLRVPANYGNTPQLIGWFTSSESDVSTSITANVMINTVGSALDVGPLVDTAVFIPTASATALTEVVLHDAMTLNPNQEMTMEIIRTGGSTATLYLHRLFLRYRPFYVMP